MTGRKPQKKMGVPEEGKRFLFRAVGAALSSGGKTSGFVPGYGEN